MHRDCRNLSSWQKPPKYATLQEKLDAIVEAAIAAPTGCNFKPYDIWLVRSPEVMKVLRQRLSHLQFENFCGLPHYFYCRY